MKRSLLILAAAAAVAAPAAAQQHQHHGNRPQGGNHAAHHAGHEHRAPEGWTLRTDRNQPAEGVQFMSMDDHFHFITGPAAVAFNPAWTHRGDYRVSARFTQKKAPQHPEAYGVVVGGRDLDGAGQRYAYLLVRGTGEYFIALRRGDERVKVADWTAHAAVAKQNAQGVAENVLGVQVRGSDVVFSVNGTEVARRPRSEIDPDGVFGFRINHNLDVKVDQVTR